MASQEWPADHSRICFMRRYEIVVILKNYMEVLVTQMVDEWIQDNNPCQCELCRLDACALALNHLPPCYVVKEQGEIFTSVQNRMQQEQVDIMMAVLNALEKVKRSPGHDGALANSKKN